MWYDPPSTASSDEFVSTLSLRVRCAAAANLKYKDRSINNRARPIRATDCAIATPALMTRCREAGGQTEAGAFARSINQEAIGSYEIVPI